MDRDGWDITKKVSTTVWYHLEVPKPVPDGTNGSSLCATGYGLNEDILIELTKNFSLSRMFYISLVSV